MNPINHLQRTLRRFRNSRRLQNRTFALRSASPSNIRLVEVNRGELLENRLLLASDFGDAPDLSNGTSAQNYQTLLSDSGPAHTIDTTKDTLFLGAGVEPDDGTLQNATANADDHFIDGGIDDEDGVISSLFDLLINPGVQPTVSLRATNVTGTPAMLYGWIDYNADGVFDNSTERAGIEVPDASNDATFTLTFPAVPIGVSTETYARFRLSTDAIAANPTGHAANGEVEDYIIRPCTGSRQTSGSYAVEPFLDSQGNCEQKIYYEDAQVGTVIQTPAGSITQRGRPEIDNVDGFGTSKQENVFVAGFDATLGMIDSAEATANGVDITASGLVAGIEGTWTWSSRVTYDSTLREVTFDGETTVDLAAQPPRDLNAGRFSSNYLFDVELNDGNRGNSGDLTTTTVTIGTDPPLLTSNLSPNPEQDAFFPFDQSNPVTAGVVSIRVNGNVNLTDPNRAAILKPTADGALVAQTANIEVFAGWIWSPSEADFSKDNLGATFLIDPNTASTQRMTFDNQTVWSIPEFSAAREIGTFTEQSPISAGSTVQALERADIDSDGDQDLIVVRGLIGQSQTNQIYVNQGDESFVLSTQNLGSGESFGVAMGDLDGDGDSDAFVANHGANRVYINQGGGNGGTPGVFVQTDQLLGSAESFDIALADLNRDGHLDAFVTNRDNEADRIWFNLGDGMFVDSGQAIDSIRGVAVSLGDVDEDGDVDALIANENNGPNRVWVNQGGAQGGSDGVFSSGQSLGFSARDVELRDIDNDGDLDALIVTPSTVSAWENDGGVFTQRQSFGAAPMGGISVGDVDGDDDLDVFLVGGPDNPLLHINQGGLQGGNAGTFSSAGQELQFNEATSDVAVADFNGDGAIDVIFADGSHNLRILFGDTKKIDYGDAPDAAPGSAINDYRTLALDDGPSHAIVDGLHLGSTVDSDRGFLQNTRATSDDLDGALPDDEDGVMNPLELRATVGAAPTLTLLATNTTGAVATLFGWIDYNRDGVFDNATERTQIAVPDDSSGERFTLTFPEIPEGSAAETYARFRLSTDAAAADSTGAASDGEVEDYVFTITAPSSGTVHDSVKIATQLNGGPSVIFDHFGSSIARIGDLDGDGVEDLAVGASQHSIPGADGVNVGAVHVLLLNIDGSVKSSTQISHEQNGGPSLAKFDRFGSAVGSVGDLDGDGVVDLVVGVANDDTGSTVENASRGAVYVLLLNSDGSAKSVTKIAHGLNGGPEFVDGDQFGTSVTSIGDLDGDGLTDLVVGAVGDDRNRGAIYVLLLNADRTVKSFTKIAHELNGGPTLGRPDLFGSSVTNIGDLDGDGVVDLVVGAKRDGTGGAFTGAVHVVFLNADGTARNITKIADELNGGPSLDNGTFFGSSVASPGDLDGDGVSDLVVGATDDQVGSDRGAVHLLLLNTDGTVKGFAKIAHELNGGPTLADGDSFGYSVTSLGDLDKDGVADLAVGAILDDTGATNSGAVYVLFLNRSGFTVGSATATVSEDGVTETDTFTVVLDGPPSSDVVFDLSLSANPDAEIDKTSLTFTAANWNEPQTVFISGVDDDVDDSDEVTTITVSVNAVGRDDLLAAVADQTIAVTTTDDDMRGVAVSSISGDASEDGSAATFTVVLESEPTTTATIGLMSSDVTEGTVAPASLVFTPENWDTPQTGTVTGVDDDIVDGDVAFHIVTVAATGGDYDGLNPTDVNVTTIDDDTAGFTLSRTDATVSEDGTTATFTVFLDARPVTDVVINVTSADVDEATVNPTTLTFTTANGNTPQTVTVTGVDDDNLDGDQQTTITLSVDGAASDDKFVSLADQTVTATTNDNELPALTIAIAVDSISESDGIAATTATVSRDGDTSADLIVSLGSSDVTEATVGQIGTVLSYDESIDGDLSTDANSPTSLPFGIGQNVVSGQVSTGSDTRDYFTFTVPANAAMTRLELQQYVDVNSTGPANTGFHAINTGSTSEVPTAGNSSLFLGGNHITAADIGSDLLPGLAAATLSGTGFTAPLGPGTYTYLIQQTGPQLTGYSLAFSVMPTVTIASGQTSASFNINAIDDTDADGTQTVTITASAAGFTDGADTIDVIDDDFVVTGPNGAIQNQRPAITWNAVDGALSYNVYLNIDGGGGNVFRQLEVSNTQASIEVPQDLEFGRYRVFVEANMPGGTIRAQDRGHTFVVEVETELTPVGATTDATPTFTWNRLPGASSYVIFINRPGSPITADVPDPGTGTTVTYTLNTALPRNDYKWWVRGIRVVNENVFQGTWGQAHEFSTGGRTKVTSPARNSTVANSTPTFTWPAVSGAQQYEVYVSQVGTPGALYRDGGITSNSIRSRVLANGDYRIWVRTTLSDGSLVWGSGVEFTVNAATNGLTVTPISPNGPSFNDSPTITWLGTIGATEYDVLLHGGNSAILETGLNGTSFIPAAALTGGAWTWSVRANNGTGFGAWSSPLAFTTNGLTSLTSPSAQTSDVTPVFSWRPVSGAISYSLQVDALTSGTPKAIREDGLTAVSFTPTVALTPGTYRAWVRAIGVSGPGPWSVPFDFVVANSEVDSQADEADSALVSLQYGVASEQTRLDTANTAQSSLIHDESPESNAIVVPTLREQDAQLDQEFEQVQQWIGAI